MFYLVEYEDDVGKIPTQSFQELPQARRRARYLSARDHSLMVYVVACTDEERIGAEGYAYGRRDNTEGRMQ